MIQAKPDRCYGDARDDSYTDPPRGRPLPVRFLFPGLSSGLAAIGAPSVLENISSSYPLHFALSHRGESVVESLYWGNARGERGGFF